MNIDWIAFFYWRANEIGYSAAYREIWGEPVEAATAREYATQLRARGFSYRKISSFVKLKFGVGSKSVVQRWLNEKSYQRHLENKRH